MSQTNREKIVNVQLDNRHSVCQSPRDAVGPLLAACRAGLAVAQATSGFVDRCARRIAAPDTRGPFGRWRSMGPEGKDLPKLGRTSKLLAGDNLFGVHPPPMEPA